MAAFDRMDCGIAGLDAAFDNIRMGDNVVWQLDELADFQYFAQPFVEEVLAHGCELNYMRFASHEPLLAEQPGVVVHRFNPNEGFEAFTLAVRNVITEKGRDAFYVFDSLSDLQVAWSADMMMGNFFRLTCPYLFELDTVAYFPVLRGQHSFAAIAKIRDTTQLLIDVYADAPGDGTDDSDERVFFIHPLKVWNRYSPTMFLAHRYCPSTGEVKVCSDGVDAARFYTLMSQADMSGTDRNIDSWDRFFLDAQREAAANGGVLPQATCTKMCNMMMAKDEFMRTLVKRYFRPQDYFAVRQRMVGTGIIGGKACGMLLAQRIVNVELPQYAARLEPHDSFYLGTDVFYSYIVANGLWPKRIAQRAEHGFVAEAPVLREGLLNGRFPDDIREQFRRILEYYGQSPIIVRSSSFLEDGMGNAFAGKYESVFCPNVGEPAARLQAFEDAVRTVYASTMDPSALEYRLINGLDAREEQMALLVQRVSGSHYGDGDAENLFMPTAAGVGYSHAAYRFLRESDEGAGMLRLVMGLGTRAVDRTTDDYPRLMSLDRPQATMTTTVAEKHRFSQHKVDLLDLNQNALVERSVQSLAGLLPPWCQKALFEHDYEAERQLRERGRRRDVLFVSCEGLAANKKFTTMMADILRVLQQAYGCPVDIEYTVNVGADDAFVVNLLQCRPLTMMADGARVEMPKLASSDVLFSVHGEAMGSSRDVEIDGLVVVDPYGYYKLAHIDKPSVAAAVGYAAAQLAERGRKHVLLLTPGRIGTSSPELGVPVSFAQIARFEGICEVAYSAAGYSPELSYGSHMFQDLVEAGIYYAALSEDTRKALYNPDMLARLKSMDARMFGPSPDEVDKTVHIFDAAGTGLRLWHDHVGNESVCGFTPPRRPHRR